MSLGKTTTTTIQVVSPDPDRISLCVPQVPKGFRGPQMMLLGRMALESALGLF